ncbi:two component transcriptional regulator, LuxR family [Methylocella silvestris BL2]|uniref:Two component transcriptional regulator, LuxR family n=1 Tax=Methylocella silvestris (strain DSM 15510 / CIP 108128 / LMG 27833 / NCIMB 13906 / BL2) TaxID=395965 RepID=B8ELY9_METSB|nr:response regulator FixJ [Methylocella silvestris]ACK50770.1 two component transcriptional regulator, LuxR family [Methylocella silvestris BL2]
MADAVVHLIDDDEAVRQALGFLLMASGYAVRVYESAAVFIEGLAEAQPGCVVTDVRMPEVDGIKLLRLMKAKRSRLPVIVMTGHADVPLAVEAMKAGAVDFLEKPFDDESLLAAIRLALDRQARDARIEDEFATIRARLEHLSPREREVLDGLVAGLPNKSIAYDLKISPRTVEVHRANVMTKMGAASLSDLVRMAFVVRSGSPS